MNESDLDNELLDYLINSTRCLVENDILEERIKNWNYFLAISDMRKLAREKYNIKISIDDFNDRIINSLYKEYENNINGRWE